MNSFNTDHETRQVLPKYEDFNVNIMTFNQSRFPRINADSLLPSATNYYSEKHHWYPPGHGDIYESMANCGLLERLIAEGKRYLFISNIDNLGATVDLCKEKNPRSRGK
jgi:UTP--glucose-1-phosphate uridylyltransferase